jgi:hypothetical protein
MYTFVGKHASKLVRVQHRSIGIAVGRAVKLLDGHYGIAVFSRHDLKSLFGLRGGYLID